MQREKREVEENGKAADIAASLRKNDRAWPRWLIGGQSGLGVDCPGVSLPLPPYFKKCLQLCVFVRAYTEEGIVVFVVENCLPAAATGAAGGS
mmetsp:Transcript_23310/g.45867  ORF Transcript_23310/g.45867 Transcript_23310/m.45867 type:complete len:93 (-) Transcript_23310:73-351(-)